MKMAFRRSERQRTSGNLNYETEKVWSGKEPACQCGRHNRCSFNCWIGKIPWRRGMATHYHQTGYMGTIKIIFQKVKSLSRVWLFATPWTVAYQAPPSMGFSRQEYWSGLPFPSPGDLHNSGIERRSPTFQADALTSEPPGKRYLSVVLIQISLILWVRMRVSYVLCLYFQRIHMQCRRLGFDSWVGKMPWTRKWQPTPVFLPGESHGQRSLAGYSTWGHKELDTTEAT